MRDGDPVIEAAKRAFRAWQLFRLAHHKLHPSPEFAALEAAMIQLRGTLPVETPDLEANLRRSAHQGEWGG